jgi:4-amino-4-deoxy-L-arabinose transferase-like glycosyltransferase
VNHVSAIISRFSVLTTAREVSGHSASIAQQDETRPHWRAREWQIAGALALLAATLNLVRLPPLSQLNLYYATAIRSMTMSWSNFFLVSFDPGGFVSVDKPPLGLWIETLSVKVFGFNSFSLIAPQAVAGILAVIVLFSLVRRVFGLWAGLIAGALLAISPINVVVNRSNIFESLVVLISLLAAWAVLQATEQGSLRWLLVSGLLIGLGFNVKMLEAWLILPACLAVYTLGAPVPMRRRLLHLALFLIMLAAISLCWIETVDHIPSSQRPWVDSTLTNSEVDLALNYNGLQRLVGQPAYSDKPQELSPGTGEPGLFRLLQAPLGPQAGWFLPLALLGLLASRWGRSNFRRYDRVSQPIALEPERANLLFWEFWLATTFIFFSVARFFNPYYLVILTPAACALAGAGAVGLWRAYLAPGWRGWLLPIAVFSAGVAHLYWLNSVSDWNSWLTPTLAFVVALTTLLLVERRQRRSRRGVMQTCAALSIVVALALAPSAWLAGSYGRDNAGWFPISGPVAADRNSFGPGPADSRLIAYLSAHHRHERMLAATVDAFDAIPIILATGQPVMAMGGYSKYDPILTTHSLALAVVNGEVRYFLLPVSNLTPDQLHALYPDEPAVVSFQTQYTNSLTKWVSEACQPVPPREWSSHSTLESLHLFDCGAYAHYSRRLSQVDDTSDGSQRHVLAQRRTQANVARAGPTAYLLTVWVGQLRIRQHMAIE